ncbi:MAG: DUF1549 domain-containing protein, partial [Verrucomicrobiales bacterium]|nr:DUF1549 domain-containing protein [Verrucomicrobiales bacterium]
MRAIWIFSLPLIFPAFARANEPAEIGFNRDIRPIFSKTCFACHGPDENAREADLRLDLREVAIAERDGFQPIVPGNAEESAVFQRMTDPEDPMPPEKFHTQLSKSEIALVKRWIDEGAKYETHWSFLPPKRPAVPAGVKAIDHLIETRLKTEDIEPAKRADRATLIRRVTLDLTGLPPTPEEVRAFLRDKSDEDSAFGKVVDRLLKSPRFAEHRTRFWLDAARYADTSGYQYDRIRHQWVWRDWVIHAFDSNMPFDQFTITQMAGDLLPDATPQTKLATGFHRNHPITIEGGVIDEEYRTEYVMDRVTTTTTTWMGLTFLCSRCHDHKYDPISQDDFYSFYAFFNNVPERGLNGFSPKERIPSPLQPADLDGLEKEITAAQARLTEVRKKMSSSFPEWEAKLREEAELLSVDFDKMEADGGTKFTPQADGSILAHGPNPATQTYRLEFTVEKEPVRAIRLEALTHPSHVNKSTGRGHNGNFVLSEVKVEAADDSGKFHPVEIESAEADYEQKGYPVAAAINGKAGRGGWAVDGNSRAADSSATFTLKTAQKPGTRLRFSMIHTWGGSHTIGRFRITVPADGQAPVSKEIHEILAIEPAKRDAAATEKLAQILASRLGGEEYAKLESELDELKKRRNKATADIPETMILTEMPKPRETFVLMRGEYDKPVKTRPVKANIPAVFGDFPAGLPRNRLGLARWLVAPENPLTARVTVNRFWAQLFGTGLVKTVEDFGSQGEYPSHPELLDWLA